MTKPGVYLILLSGAVVALAAGPAGRKPNAADPAANGAAIASERLMQAYGKLPLSFEANRGQTDGRVQFLARSRGYTLFLTGDQAVLSLPMRSASPAGGSSDADAEPPANSGRANPQESAVVRFRLDGANPGAKAAGLDELPGKANYFLGSDPHAWRSGVPTFARVRYANVYPGVDLVYHGSQGGELEYDFVVAPGADADSITLDLGAGPLSASGKSSRLPLRIAENGDLVIPVHGSEVRFHKPIVYQDANSESTAGTAGSALQEGTAPHREFREGRFVLDAQNRVRFQLGPYDRTRPLVIDPVVVYSTYLGGNGTDIGLAIAADPSGNAYVTGYTSSTNFPTAGAVDGSLGGAGVTNAFVSKLSWNGSALTLVYSTYLGGNGGEDEGWGIAADSSGNAYVAGNTNSRNFPTMNPLQAAFAGGAQDVFVTALNPTGSALIYSTYLGGSRGDYANAIAVDSSGNAYIAGETNSANFPMAHPLQASELGTYNAFVSKLNWNGSALSLVYSTYLGGSSVDSADGIAIDYHGNAYVIGKTTSANFPTANAVQPSLGGAGAQNAFVSELSWNGSALGLVYSTYLGGSNSDTGWGIAVDSAGNAYVTGFTFSTDFPTANALQPTFTGTEKAFVSKLHWNGSALSLPYSTYLGGSNADFGLAIALDPYGNTYVTGGTSSPDFPTVNATQPTLGSPNAQNNAFVTKLNSTGSALLFSTYLGNTYEDGHGIAVDAFGDAYVIGLTKSSDFPTVNPLQANLAGAENAWVAKISTSDVPTLNGNNAFNGNETVNGSVAATSFTGNGAGLTGVMAAGLNCAGCVGNAQLGIDYAGSTTQGGPAVNSLLLGGLPASAFATLLSNSFTGDQAINGNLTLTGNLNAAGGAFSGSVQAASVNASGALAGGSLAIGGGTPITEYISVTDAITLPALNSGECTTFETAPLTGFTPGSADTISLGVPSGLLTGLNGNPGSNPFRASGHGPTIFLVYQAWESSQAASPTITLQVCDPGRPYPGGDSGTVRIDVFKH